MDTLMKKILALLLRWRCWAARRWRKRTRRPVRATSPSKAVTETVNETLFTSASGYSIWLQEGWGWSASTDDAALDNTVTDETAVDDTVTDETAAADDTVTDETAVADETAADETAADDGTWLDAEADAADDGTWLGEESLNYAPDVYVPDGSADVSLTVQPAAGLTADDADDMLAEASYTEDTEATIGEIRDVCHGKRRGGQEHRSCLRRRMLPLLLHPRRQLFPVA